MVGNKSKVILGTAIAIIILDQILKALVNNKLAVNESIPIIKGLFHITYINNSGAVFGMLKQSNWIIIWISIIAIGLIIYYYDKIPDNNFVKVMAAFVIGGIIGNLIDRLVHGFVIDFIDLRVWPVFNIADIALTAGVIGLIIWMIKKG